MHELGLFQCAFNSSVCRTMKLSSWNLPVTKFIKQNHSWTKLFITEDDLDLLDLHFHKHCQMVAETKHFPKDRIYWYSSVGRSGTNFYPHLILWKETKISWVLFFNFSYLCSIPRWKSCFMTAQCIWKTNKKQLNQSAQNLGLMVFIFVTPF